MGQSGAICDQVNSFELYLFKICINYVDNMLKDWILPLIRIKMITTSFCFLGLGWYFGCSPFSCNMMGKTSLLPEDRGSPYGHQHHSRKYHFHHHKSTWIQILGSYINVIVFWWSWIVNNLFYKCSKIFEWFLGLRMCIVLYSRSREKPGFQPYTTKWSA